MVHRDLKLAIASPGPESAAGSNGKPKKISI